MKSTVETKICELVKSGHELAKELHCAESAALVSDLATQLEVQFARSNALAAKLSMINGLMDAAEQANKLAQEATEKLVQERDALAAENAFMQQVIGEVQILYYESDGIVGYHLNGEVAKWDDVMPDLWAETPATDAFLAEVRAQGVEEFLRDSQLPYQIATVLADYDNVDDATLQTVIWSGQPPEPDGDIWHLEYVSRGNAIVRAVLNDLRKGVQS